jgi:hypothetical protein
LYPDVLTVPGETVLALKAEDPDPYGEPTTKVLTNPEMLTVRVVDEDTA